MIGIAVIIKQMKKTKTIGNLIDIEILTCFTCLFNEEGGGGGVYELKTFNITQLFTLSISVEMFKRYEALSQFLSAVWSSLLSGEFFH